MPSPRSRSPLVRTGVKDVQDEVVVFVSTFIQLMFLPASYRAKLPKMEQVVSTSLEEGFKLQAVMSSQMVFYIVCGFLYLTLYWANKKARNYLRTNGAILVCVFGILQSIFLLITACLHQRITWSSQCREQLRLLDSSSTSSGINSVRATTDDDDAANRYEVQRQCVFWALSGAYITLTTLVQLIFWATSYMQRINKLPSNGTFRGGAATSSYSRNENDDELYRGEQSYQLLNRN